MQFRARLVTFAALSSMVLLAGCGDFYGKPRGTLDNNAATRAVDRAAGTNTSSENPIHSDSTAVGRTLNKLTP
jgi:hypothetical protein